MAEYSTYPGPVLMIGCAGGTDALSGTASYLAKFPVVSCPPDGMNQTCLTNPPGSSNAFILKPANVGKFAAQMLAHAEKTLLQHLMRALLRRSRSWSKLMSSSRRSLGMLDGLRPFVDPPVAALHARL